MNIDIGCGKYIALCPYYDNFCINHDSANMLAKVPTIFLSLDPRSFLERSLFYAFVFSIPFFMHKVEFHRNYQRFQHSSQQFVLVHCVRSIRDKNWRHLQNILPCHISTRLLELRFYLERKANIFFLALCYLSFNRSKIWTFLRLSGCPIHTLFFRFEIFTINVPTKLFVLP